MCGIAAIFSYRDGQPVAESELLTIRDRMTSRGPDGAGLWISADRSVGLAHRRLAILDLSPSGAQPMFDETGTFGISFNGEIYNYRELRAELVDRGEARVRPRVVIQWWPRPTIAPGALSWVTDLLTLVGAENPLGHEPVKSRPVRDAELADLSPDVLVLSWCGVQPEKVRPDVVLNNPALQNVKAVQKGRVYCVPEAYLGRPGPRLVEGYRALRGIVETYSA